MAQVILEFVGDPTGLKPVVDELNKITGVSEKQAQNFQKVNQEFAKGSEEVKKQAGEFEKLSQKVKNIPIAISGERISKSFKEMGDSAKGAVTGIEQARKKLDDTRRTMSELEKINNEFKRTLFEQEQALKALGTGWSKEAPAIRQRIEGLKTAIQDNNLALKDMKISEKDAAGQIKFFTQQEKALNKNIGTSALLTSQLRKMKDQLANFQGSEQEFIKLQNEAAKLGIRIKEVNDRIRVLSSPTFTFDAFIGATQGIVGAFTAAQGAMALAGGESEDFQKTIIKVTGSLAVLQGLQATVNALQKQSPAILFAQAAATKVYTFVTNAATLATRAFNLALVGLGVIGIIAAIAALVANWDKLSKAIGLSTSELEENNKALERAEANSKKLREENERRIQTIKDEVESLKLQGAERDKIVKAEILANERIIAINEARILSTSRLIGELREEERVGHKVINGLDELEKEITDLHRETLLLRDANIGLTKSLEELNAQSRKTFDATIIKSTREWKEEQLKLAEALAKAFLSTDAATQAIERYKKAIEELPEKVEPISIKTDFELPTGAEGLTAEQADALKAFGTEAAGILADTFFEIGQQNRDAEFQALLSDLDRRREAELSNKNLTDSQKKRIEDKFRKEEAKIKTEQFNAEKKASSIQAIINGALAVTKTLAQLGFTPAGIAAAALSAVATAAQLAIINRQNPPKFAKGTKSAPEGFAWVGEQGAELVHLNAGAKVLTAPDSKKFAAGVEVPRIAEKYGMNFSHLEMPKYSTPTFTIDYNKMAKSFAEELKNNPQFNLSIDKNGIQVFMQQRNRRVEYLNSKFDV